jgi:hypothetical protein
MTQSYNCNDADLYLGIQSLCTVGENHQQFLFDKKTIYTTAFFTQLRAAVETARNLPDADSNIAKSATARKTLIEQKNALLAEYQCIKSYIEELFPDKKQWKDIYDSAGQAHYKAASSDDWTGLDNLMTKSTHFITENEAALREKGGMPTDFKANYAQIVADTRVRRTEFMDKKGDVSDKNLTKKSANEALYETVKKICRDAKKYFTDKTIADKFVWDNILINIGSTASSSSAQRRKTIKEKEKEKTLFDAKLLGLTMEDYVHKLKVEAQAEKEAKKMKGKKGRKRKTTAPPEVVEQVAVAVPLLIAGKE